MSRRASLVYVAMFAVLLAGLWAIVRAGAHLAAPADLEGEWTLAWASEASDLPSKLSIEQSGVFTKATLPGSPALAGRLSKPHGSPVVRGDLASHDGRWRLTLAPFAGGDVLVGTLDAPARASFTATRASARPKSGAAANTATTKPGEAHARQ